MNFARADIGLWPVLKALQMHQHQHIMLTQIVNLVRAVLFQHRALAGWLRAEQNQWQVNNPKQQQPTLFTFELLSS